MRDPIRYAAGLTTALNDNSSDDDDLRPARGIVLAVGIAFVAWLGLIAAIVAAVAS